MAQDLNARLKNVYAGGVYAGVLASGNKRDAERRGMDMVQTT